MFYSVGVWGLVLDAQSIRFSSGRVLKKTHATPYTHNFV